MRSRTGSLPRSRWRSIERSSPPAPRSATVRLAGAQVIDEGGHRVVVGARLGGGRVEPAAQDGHGADDRSRTGGTRRASVRRPCRSVPRPLPLVAGRPRRGRRLLTRRRWRRCCPPRPLAARRRSRPAAASVRRARAARRWSSSATAGSTRRRHGRRRLGTVPPECWRPWTRPSRRPTSTRSAPAVHRGVPGRTSTARRSIYEFGAPSGVERIASCETEIDPRHPLFAAVDPRWRPAARPTAGPASRRPRSKAASTVRYRNAKPSSSARGRRHAARAERAGRTARRGRVWTSQAGAGNQTGRLTRRRHRPHEVDLPAGARARRIERRRRHRRWPPEERDGVVDMDPADPLPGRCQADRRRAGGRATTGTRRGRRRGRGRDPAAAGRPDAKPLRMASPSSSARETRARNSSPIGLASVNGGGSSPDGVSGYASMPDTHDEASRSADVRKPRHGVDDGPDRVDATRADRGFPSPRPTPRCDAGTRDRATESAPSMDRARPSTSSARPLDDPRWVRHVLARRADRATGRRPRRRPRAATGQRPTDQTGTAYDHDLHRDDLPSVLL